MVSVIDRPPVVGGKPPELPPYLRRRGSGPERRVLILPDLCRIEVQTIIRDRDNNWETIIYQWMDRIVGDGLWDPEATWELAHTSTRRYRSWLETYNFIDGIPPHIQFGGAIAPGERDETFYPRWRDYAKEMFV